MTERVVLRRGETRLEGWALNVSRGGVRLILEEAIELGDTFEVTLGDDPLERTGKVVWLQEEPDGVVCGLAYKLGANEGPKTVPPPPPGSRIL